LAAQCQNMRLREHCLLSVHVLSARLGWVLAGGCHGASNLCGRGSGWCALRFGGADLQAACTLIRAECSERAGVAQWAFVYLGGSCHKRRALLCNTISGHAARSIFLFFPHICDTQARSLSLSHTHTWGLRRPAKVPTRHIAPFFYPKSILCTKDSPLPFWRRQPKKPKNRLRQPPAQAAFFNWEFAFSALPLCAAAGCVLLTVDAPW
jgi:hypothetical protein